MASDWLVATYFVASVGTDDAPRYVGGSDLETAQRFTHPGAAIEAARGEGHAVCTVVRLCLRGSVHTVSLTGVSVHYDDAPSSGFTAALTDPASPLRVAMDGAK